MPGIYSFRSKRWPRRNCLDQIAAIRQNCQSPFRSWHSRGVVGLGAVAPGLHILVLTTYYTQNVYTKHQEKEKSFNLMGQGDPYKILTKKPVQRPKVKE